ncbi:MAG: co-chaperone GroES [Rickettsiales bacterium]|nr:MAG: co-chaperone GroES [Rickettsiales bacterium]
MNFRPLHDRIAIKAVATEEKTTGGIIIPDSAQEKPMQGEVVAVGTGARDQNGNIIPLDVQVGDIIVYGKWGGNELKVDGEDLIIMKESDVMGIIKK